MGSYPSSGEGFYGENQIDVRKILYINYPSDRLPVGYFRGKISDAQPSTEPCVQMRIRLAAKIDESSPG
jgi:hypothetical protein